MWCWFGVTVAFVGMDCGGIAAAVDDRIAVSAESRLESTDLADAAQAGSTGVGPRGCNAGRAGMAPSCSSEAVSALASAGESGGATTEPVSSHGTISEVKFDPPGTDGNYEFIELRGQPAAELAGHWLVAIEGDQESNRGQVDAVIDLSVCGTGVCQFDQKGLLLLVPDPTATLPASGSSWRLSNELAKGGLENGTVSLLLLVGRWAGTAGLDWDSDDDGALELPDGVVAIDAVAWTDGDSDDATYAPAVLGPKPKPQAIWSCGGVVGKRDWRYGQLLGESASLIVDAAHSVPEGLDAFALTPGEENNCQLLAVVASTTTSGAVAGTAGMTSAPGNAGCGGAVSAGGIDTTSRGGAVSAGGIDTTSRGGAWGVASHESGSSASMTGNAGVASTGGRMTAPAVNSSAAGGVVTPPQTNSGPGGGQVGSTSGCGGVALLVVAAPLTSVAGNSGWWSPTPFSSARGGQLVGSGGGDSILFGGATSATSGPPPMPTGCGVHQRPSGSTRLLLFLGVVGLATRRRRTS